MMNYAQIVYFYLKNTVCKESLNLLYKTVFTKKILQSLFFKKLYNKKFINHLNASNFFYTKFPTKNNNSKNESSNPPRKDILKISKTQNMNNIFLSFDYNFHRHFIL